MYSLADPANFVPPILVFNLIILNISNLLIPCDWHISFKNNWFYRNGNILNFWLLYMTSIPDIYWVHFSYFRCFPETESGHLLIQNGVQGQCLASLHHFGKVLFGYLRMFSRSCHFNSNCCLRSIYSSLHHSGSGDTHIGWYLVLWAIFQEP